MPTPVTGGHRFSSIEMGNASTFLRPVCGVDLEGLAWCWGTPFEGNLGTGNLPDLCPFNGQDYRCALNPRLVQGDLRYDRVVPGQDHICAEVRGGRTACWGGNSRGQLGTGNRVEREAPTLLGLPAGFGLVGAGGHTSCRLTTGGVYCWGSSPRGQAGIDGFVASPFQLPGSDWEGLTSSACGVSQSGAVRCWGPLINLTRALGSELPGSAVTDLGGPVMTQVSGSGEWACGLDSAGAAWCWGRNTVTLGDVALRTPVRIGGDRSFKAMSVGVDHACAVEASTDQAWCWGSNSRGQLGNTTTLTASAVPGPVAGGRRFAEIAAGYRFTCATELGNGNVWCWGDGRFGQMGSSIADPVTSPRLVQGLAGTTGISAGSEHVCALNDNNVLCWGANQYGQSGASGSPVAPTVVPGLFGATRVRASSVSSCAIRSGTVYCWGGLAATYRGAFHSNPVPTPVPGIQGALDVAPGFTTCVLAESRISCWGDNADGAVGAPLPQVLSPARLGL